MSKIGILHLSDIHISERNSEEVARLLTNLNYQWDYNGITGILGSLLGLDLIIPLIICIIFFICGAVVCFKAIGEK